MELRLSGAVVDTLVAKKHPIATANKTYRRPGEPLTIDLGDVELPDLVSLHDILDGMAQKMLKEEGKKAKGLLYLQAQAREVRVWLTIMEDPSGKIGKLYRLPSMLREFLMSKRVFRLYKLEAEQSDVWLPYAVTGADFTPGSKKKGITEHATVYLAYYWFGEVKKTAIHIYGGASGKTVEQVLLDRGYRIETKELYQAWQADVERYLKLRGNYGFQVLGKGYGMQESGDRYYRRTKNLNLTMDGVAARLVVHKEAGDGVDTPATYSAKFWVSKRDEEFDRIREMNFQRRVEQLDDDEYAEYDPSQDDPDDDPDEGVKEQQMDVPLHAYTTFFDLEKHYELDAHVRAVEDYVYDKDLADKLVLPAEVKDLVDMLLDDTAGKFKDIVAGKSSGTIVLLSGPPGTGKTLTAEVYSERCERPLYKISSSQLGISPAALEAELKAVLGRAALWNALLLIDECDVFVHHRGDDIEQNAVVGIILRVLEYFQGVLFLTTNRETIVDDAILSRCTAAIKYQIPEVDEQLRIWRILADGAGIPIKEEAIHDIIQKYPNLPGRDIKNVLKLGHLVMRRKNKKTFTVELVDFVVRFMATQSLRKEGDLVDHVAKPKQVTA